MSGSNQFSQNPNWKSNSIAQSLPLSFWRGYVNFL